MGVGVDGWRLGIASMIADRLRAVPTDPAVARRLLDEKSTADPADATTKSTADPADATTKSAADPADATTKSAADPADPTKKSARSATPWQHAPGLIRLHLAGQFEDVESPEYDERFGIAVVPTEADLLPIFEEARACLEDRLGLGEPVSYGLRWRLGDFVVALLHTDAIGDGHIGEGKTVEVRVFDPAVVTEPTRDGFAWPDLDLVDPPRA